MHSVILSETSTGTLWLFQLSKMSLPREVSGDALGASLLSSLDVTGMCLKLEAFLNLPLLSYLFSFPPTEQWQQGCWWLPLPCLHSAALWLSGTARVCPSSSGTAQPALMNFSSSSESWLQPRAIPCVGQGLLSHPRPKIGWVL